MTLKIIGVGFGRTGTSSVRDALDEIGYKCYHMTELLFRPDRKGDVDFWRKAWAAPDRSAIDWSEVYGGYAATIDYPGCAFWRDLTARFPEAKVLLTHHPRGPEGWYQSTIDTIYGGAGPAGSTDFGRKVNDMLNEIVWEGLLVGTMDDKDAAIARYNAHTEEVKDTIPADRLLEFSADQGWGPLAAFLGLPPRDEPFPRANDREAMTRMVARLQRMKDFAKARGEG